MLSRRTKTRQLRNQNSELTFLHVRLQHAQCRSCSPAGVDLAQPGRSWPLPRHCKTGTHACQRCCSRNSAQFIAAPPTSGACRMRSLVLSLALATMFITAPVARGRTPPMGWRSWNHFAWKVTAPMCARRPMPWFPVVCAPSATSTSTSTTPGGASAARTRRPCWSQLHGWLERDHDNTSQTLFGQQMNPRYTGFCSRSSLAGSSNTTRRPLPSARGSA